MDESTMLIAASCAALAILVYLMWRSATAQEWGEFARNEKKRWRSEEEKRKQGKA